MNNNRWFNQTENFSNIAGTGGGTPAPGGGTSTGKTGGTSTGTGTGTGSSSPNTSNGLTAGLTATIPGTPTGPTTYTRHCWTTQCPSTLGSYSGLTTNACPAGTVEAVAEPNCSLPATNPNQSQGLSVGVTNQGMAPSQGCPCEYNMNCWSDTCPSTMTTQTALPGMSCPAGTVSSEPNCMIPGSNPNNNSGLNTNWPGSTQSAPVGPTTYSMNCWSQQCPSNLQTYTGLSTATCPSLSQVPEPNCSTGSGGPVPFSGNGWY